MTNQEEHVKFQTEQRRLNALNDLRMYQDAIGNEDFHSMTVIEFRQSLNGYTPDVVCGALELKAVGANFDNFLKLAGKEASA